MAHAQLHLIDFADEQWKLDPHTIEVGRRGLATARAALARSARPFATAHRHADEWNGIDHQPVAA
jgi:hypothetical protein